jgi:hypothetical protein
MIDNFPGTWIKNQWTTMTKKVGFEKEKALLPATMPELSRKREENRKQMEWEKLQRIITKLQKKQREIRASNDSSNTTEQDKQFKGRKCADENCRGYLSSQWKCGVCDMWSCPQCHKLKGLHRDSPHVCNPDDVATAELLNRDTKACPSCSTPIFKISGCDQMWCTECHTAFSWRTGVIQTNGIHNPHYFAWRRDTNNGEVPRTPGDVDCGRDLSDSRALLSIRGLIRALNDNDLKTCEKQIENMIRGTIHLQRVNSTRFRTYQTVNNMDIRIQYLEKKINEANFCGLILRRKKAFEKKQDIYNVIQLAITANTDIAYRFETELKNIDTSSSVDRLTIKENVIDICKRHIDEVINITDYCNNLLKEHHKTYGCKKYSLNFHIDDTNNWYHVLY